MSEKIISEATPIRIGLVILFLGAFGSGVWWAASINTKLDSIITNQSTVNGTMSEMKTAQLSVAKELNDITLRVAILESRVESPKK